MTEQEPVDEPQPHPIHLVSTDDLQRNRLTVFFRLLLALPHLIVLTLWGIAAFVVLVIAWFAGLVLGRLPDGMHGFLASYVRYATHVNAYVLIAADPFPAFSGSADYPVDVEIAPAAPQNRLTIFFRGLLAIPAYIVWWVLSNVAQLVSIGVWFFALITGRQHAGMQELLCYCVRYQAQVHGYYFLLTQRYPSFSDD